jgi:hypothetical protein
MTGAAHRAWACAAILLALSCGPSNVFTCDDDAQCVDGDRNGRCEASGYCSFPDAGCPEGYRYSAHAAERFAGICVPPANADGSTSDAVDDSPSSGSPTSGASDPMLDTTAADDAVTVTTPTATSAEDGSTSHVEPTSTSDAESTNSDDAADTMPASSDESTSTPMGDPYEFCLDDTECTYPQATCMYDSWALPVCNPACSGPLAIDECPPPTSGEAVPACRDIAGGEWGCVLDCTDGECPEGMVCSDSTIGPFCFWA